MSRAIGIIGGIFDPIHYGHLAIGVLAYEYFNLEKIIYIPSGNPPHKSCVSASAEDRLEMLKIALHNTTFAEIWDSEVKSKKISYTFYTLQEISFQNPKKELYFIIGADNLPEIPTWHRYKEILQMVTLCVTERPPFKPEIPPELKEAKIKFFPSPYLGISSSLIRQYIAKGYSCKYLLPEGVREYIINKRLYR
ncbi:MAG: nicotinate-nucleotide adenylyltransferase [Chitinispirillaceae bacterium]|nr:nicotinate-nucleotide adenylyltransferase [Chitinispirillaceae bacterium]